MKFRFLISAVLALASVTGAGAQPVRDYGFTKDTNPFLSYSNPAFLGAWKDGKISMVELSGAKENGSLVSVEDSDDDLRAGAVTESFVRVSDRISFYGNLGYDYFTGKDMGGQILMDPGYNPFNFLETTDTTRGVKTRELYKLGGGMSYAFDDRWTAGVKGSFEGGNQAKRRDPRFLNTWLDMGVAAGFSFTPSRKNAFGLDLLYRRTIEQVHGGTYGKKDYNYLIWTDKGGFYGVSEALDGNTPALAETENRPIVNAFYGAALQYSYMGENKFFNELSFLLRDGRYGSTGDSTPTFFEFDGIEFAYSGTALIPMGNNLNRISLDAGFGTLNNAENSFKYVTTPGGGVTTVQYSGQKHIFHRTDISADLSYVFCRDVSSGRPQAEYGADAVFFMRSQKTSIFPYWREHSHLNVDATVWARRNFRCGSAGLLTPAVYGHFFTGAGEAAKDGAATTAKSKTLKSFDFWMYRQFEYDTATRAGVQLALSYTRFITGGLAIYVAASDSYVSMLKAPVYLPGGARNVASLTIGCNF